LEPLLRNTTSRGKKASEIDISEVSARTLIYFPIIHTRADMGAFSDIIYREKAQKLGGEGLKRNLSLIDKLWTEIEKAIEHMPLPYERVRLYQDGLPVCGREVEIVSELARTGSRNHRLLLGLEEKGATIMGTESPELLLEEYELIKALLVLGESEEASRSGALQKEPSNSLIERRDRYIARRINETLLVNETGILFIGMLHRLTCWLDKGIRVIYPLNSGSFQPGT
jgi:hypothetical protein